VYAGKVAYTYKGTMSANTSITLSSDTRGIADSAFSDCTDLTNITIPDSVTSIGKWAFSYCTGLTSVIIPNSVTSIGWQAFAGCTGLISVTFATGSNIADANFGNSAFHDGMGGDSLKNAYATGKAGTYTSSGGYTWTKVN